MIFVGLSFYAVNTKKDFSFMTGMVLGAFITAVVLMVVNILLDLVLVCLLEIVSIFSPCLIHLYIGEGGYGLLFNPGSFKTSKPSK